MAVKPRDYVIPRRLRPRDFIAHGGHSSLKNQTKRKVAGSKKEAWD